MFTILSNMFMGLMAAMCIPYTVDGMRYRNYHLPRWIINLMYVATNGVALTFLIALTVLSPATSFYRMMIYSNNILFHTICPLLSIVLFPLIFLICFGISALLRAVHNLIHERRKADIEKYYQRTEAFAYPDIQSAIRALADIDRPRDKGGELVVPRRIISMMEKNYKSGLEIGDMCKIYIDEYYGKGTEVDR